MQQSGLVAEGYQLGAAPRVPLTCKQGMARTRAKALTSFLTAGTQRAASTVDLARRASPYEDAETLAVPGPWARLREGLRVVSTRLLSAFLRVGYSV